MKNLHWGWIWKNKLYRSALGSSARQGLSDPTVTCALRQPTLNSRRLREQFRAGTNINVSDQTLLNRLHTRNLRARHPVVPQSLARQHRIARQCSVGIYSSSLDSCRMAQWRVQVQRWLYHDGRAHVWRRPGERHDPQCIASCDRWS